VQIYCSPVILHRCRHNAAGLYSIGVDILYWVQLHRCRYIADLLVFSSRATLYRGKSPGILQQSCTLQGKISRYAAAELHSTGEDLQVYSSRGVCSTDLRLDTSTNGLKQIYTSPEAI
jgi:hypothetical protein